MLNSSLKYRSTTPTQSSRTSDAIPRQRRAILTRWINSLSIWPRMQEKDLPDQMKTGTFLAKLLPLLDSKIRFLGFYKNPVAKKACLHNLEQILSIVWKRSVRAHRMPTAEELLVPKTEKSWQLINVIFESFILNELRVNAKSCWTWFETVLGMYGRNFDIKNPGAEFQKGTNIAYVLNCFHKKVDLRQIYYEPTTRDKILQNLCAVFSVMESLQLKMFVTPEEFAANADEEFNLLQMFQIYKAFKDQVPNPVNNNMIVFKDGVRPISLNESASTCSVFSIASESLDYSTSTIALSQLPSEVDLMPKGFFSQFTPKFSSKESTSDRWSFSSKIEDSTKNTFSSDSSRRDPSMEFKNSISFEVVSPANTSYTDSTTEKLKRLEELNATQERKLMYIADSRTKTEQKIKTRQMPSLTRIKVKEDQKKNDDYLLQLLKPRFLKLIKDRTEKTYCFCLVPNNEKFSYESEDYTLEWRDLLEMNLQGKLNIEDILSIECVGRYIIIKSNEDNMQLQFPNEFEASQYAQNLNRVLLR
ncbi:unnamed protein product [Blepharisma stoltei]|uniref:Calponin-homology (CH) domain-containing protein n=1 Tax=Blepharisma stoltei TaxID=1481888 RepID=A0AAU9JWU3_9CILI|nr:unnamed protein product [Blepharisma stoltei]